MREIEFVSYSGKYPNLCSGVLVLRISGERVAFGYGTPNPPFWISGGYCRRDWVESGPWEIMEEELPDELRDRGTVLWIQELLNQNIPYGCCGGCR